MLVSAANASFVGTVHLGSENHRLKVHAWEFTVPGTNTVNKLMVTADDCTPVAQAIYGSVNGGWYACNFA